jgi:ABC-2 type transport system permease protein
LQIARLSYAKSATYRVDYVLRLARIVIELTSSILFIDVIFSKTNSLVGWSKPEMFLVYAIWILILCTQYLFTSDSFFQTSQDIQKGKLDFLLTKPMDSQFLASFRQVHVDNIIRILGAVVILVYSLFALQINVSNLTILLFLFQLVSGTIAFYSFMFLSVIFTFYTLGIEQLSIFDSLLQVGKYPTDIFPKSWSVIFWSILPVAYFSTLPARTLLGKIDTVSYVLSVVIPFVLLFAVRKLWYFSLRFYFSASS